MCDLLHYLFDLLPYLIPQSDYFTFTLEILVPTKMQSYKNRFNIHLILNWIIKSCIFFLFFSYNIKRQLFFSYKRCHIKDKRYEYSMCAWGEVINNVNRSPLVLPEGVRLMRCERERKSDGQIKKLSHSFPKWICRQCCHIMCQLGIKRHISLCASLVFSYSNNQSNKDFNTQ